MGITRPIRNLGIGWGGVTARDMLEESERQFEQTGRYCSLDKLEFRASSLFGRKANPRGQHLAF